MLLPSPVVNQNIIEENQHKSPQLPPKDMVHTRLEGSQSVSQPKWHDQELEVPLMALGKLSWGCPDPLP